MTISSAASLGAGVRLDLWPWEAVTSFLVELCYSSTDFQGLLSLLFRSFLVFLLSFSPSGLKAAAPVLFALRCRFRNLRKKSGLAVPIQFFSVFFSRRRSNLLFWGRRWAATKGAFDLHCGRKECGDI